MCRSVLLYFAQDFIPEIEKYKGGKGTTPGSIVGQGVAEPVALAFDVLGSTILTTVEKGLSYVGDETKQAFVNFLVNQEFRIVEQELPINIVMLKFIMNNSVKI